MRIATFCVLVFALALGCAPAGEKTVGITGTVVKDGKPYTFSAQGLPPGDPGFRLEFIRVTDGGTAGDVSPAVFNAADGSFTVAGSKGSGLPAGKYKVTVEKGVRGLADEFKAAFTADKTPLTVTVPSADKAVIEVDLDKKTVTVK